ncbi:MAG: hypothetical protein JSS61_02625 [Verrucomicrobia bacterium]|nr:hypothetical protein [Verrucomicrobiota bacterium]
MTSRISELGKNNLYYNQLCKSVTLREAIRSIPKVAKAALERQDAASLTVLLKIGYKIENSEDWQKVLQIFLSKTILREERGNLAGAIVDSKQLGRFGWMHMHFYAHAGLTTKMQSELQRSQSVRNLINSRLQTTGQTALDIALAANRIQATMILWAYGGKCALSRPESCSSAFLKFLEGHRGPKIPPDSLEAFIEDHSSFQEWEIGNIRHIYDRFKGNVPQFPTIDARTKEIWDLISNTDYVAQIDLHEYISQGSFWVNRRNECGQLMLNEVLKNQPGRCIIERLLRTGADPFETDILGETAFFHAKTVEEWKMLLPENYSKDKKIGLLNSTNEKGDSIYQKLLEDPKSSMPIFQFVYEDEQFNLVDLL